MAVKKKATKTTLTPKGKWPIMNFRAKPETKARLRVASRRLGMSQSELMRRFVAALPAATTKLPKSVSVNLAA